MVLKIELLQIQNLTIGVEILSPNAPTPFEVVEWKETSLVFQTSIRAAPGQLLSLVGKVTIDKDVLPFEATGKITSVLPQINTLNRFEIHLQQYDRPLWLRFLKAIRAKQNRADNIFKSIRGDD